MRSFISTFPMRAPLRMEGEKYGAFDMLSMPPATTTSASPSAITRAPSITASRPEPHTLLTVTQGVVLGSPAYRAAWRAGACPTPPCSTWPMKTVFTSSGFTPARSIAALMTTAPRRGAGRLDSEPWNAPIGVLAAPTITTSRTLRSGAMDLLLDLVRRFHNRVGAVKRRSLCYVGAPMPYAGDLTRVEFDRLLDQRGGPAVAVHGGAGTSIGADPSRHF